MKSKKGITLIALIITIIVMLILVGVTVSVALNGGLFNMANQASRRTEKARKEESLNAVLWALKGEMYANPELYTINTRDQASVVRTLTKILNEIEKYFELDSRYIYENQSMGIRMLNLDQLEDDLKCIYEGENYDIIIIPCKFEGEDFELYIDVKQDGQTIKVEDFYKKEVDAIEIKDKPAEVATVGGNIASVTTDGVPIPKGFYYVTGTIDTGVVISDNQADENNSMGNNGNQFVWVPVKVNPRLEIELETGKTIKEIRILNLAGYDETFNVNSNYFQKTINLTHNDLYEVIVKYEDGTEEEIIKEVDNVYDRNTAIYTATIKMIDVSEEEFFEILKDTVLKNNPNLELNYKVEILKAYAEQNAKYEDKDNVSENEKASVLKYGGFYMGRYEAKVTDGITTVKKGQLPTSSIAYDSAKTAAESMYNDEEKYGVKAELPSAAAWDTIGTWLIKTKNKYIEDVYFASAEWGNIRTSLLESGKKTLASTGSTSNYEAKNMYDLAGNLEEWTKEVRITVEKDDTTGEDKTVERNIPRGGYYNGIGTGFSTRNEKDEADKYSGFRPMLYIKN